MIPYKWIVVCASMVAALSAAEMIPTEDFARAPAFSQMKLSPDGQYIAFLREKEGEQTLFFSDLVKKQTNSVNAGRALTGYGDLGQPIYGPRKEVISFNWISDRRVTFTTAFWDQYVSGMSAVDRDGKRWTSVTGIDAFRDNGAAISLGIETIYSFGGDGQYVLMLDRFDRGFKEGEQTLYPDVAKVDTLGSTYKIVVQNPGNVVAWGVDHAGCVRLGVTMANDLKVGFIYRKSEDEPWHTLPAQDDTHGRIRPLAFDYSNQKFYAAALSPQKRWAIYQFDPATGTLGDVVMEDPEYDLISETLIPAVDGTTLARAILSKQKQSLIGVSYVTEGPRTRWLDPEFVAHQKNIDAALPRTVNLITSRTQDEKRMLVLAFSDKDPGTYYIFDATDNSLTRIASRMDWIKSDLMASMYPIEYPARDGQTIHGYLTLPPGRPHKNLPLVVMPHGGPWVRDVWGFNPLVQLLANRGYAVLQMNYRGSPGYGETFYKKGSREVGRGIQDDIEDGTRWAIAKKLADPKRIAIVGGSYGGYSALFALGHNDDLYRCGISIAGVTDWLGIIKGKTDGIYKFSYQYWVKEIGDPKNEEEFLKSVSPVNFADKITVPLLIIQGEDDRTVPPKQAHAMIDALEKAGRQPESLFVANEGHGFRREEDRIKEYKAIEAFLMKNLGSGAQTEAPPAAVPASAAKPTG